MRVKLQLVMCSDDGQGETVIDIVPCRRTPSASSIWA
jgi:hypothetical protein